MSLKRRDTAENRKYWDFVERTAREVEENRPAWVKKLHSQKTSPKQHKKG